MAFEELLRRPWKKPVPKPWSRSRKRMAIRGGLIVNRPPSMCATALLTETFSATALATETIAATALVAESFSATALVMVC